MNRIFQRKNIPLLIPVCGAILFLLLSLVFMPLYAWKTVAGIISVFARLAIMAVSFWDCSVSPAKRKLPIHVSTTAGGFIRDM